MAARARNAPGGQRKASSLTNLIAGGGAGMVEALVCHPLGRLDDSFIRDALLTLGTDTVKVRMQLPPTLRVANGGGQGLARTVAGMIKQSPSAFYKGFGPVIVGIFPKMGIRFTSFEAYKQMLSGTGPITDQKTFLAGLAAGVTEAVTVVTTMEVIKVRLQAQNSHSGAPGHVPKYRNMAQAFYTIVKEEGPGALFNGMSLTALRQATNVSVNLTVYTKLKEYLQKWQPAYRDRELPVYQTALIGMVAGMAGPISNAPIDALKTRVQRAPISPGQSGLAHTIGITQDLFRQEGYSALYRGILPRVMRIGPGQAITYTMYEFFKNKMTGGPERIP
ncbi:hypothetical protein MMC13_002638 [Lambiella insularis]|nr:hypothetical protein [Lambiella insularis]